MARLKMVDGRLMKMTPKEEAELLASLPGFPPPDKGGKPQKTKPPKHPTKNGPK